MKVRASGPARQEIREIDAWWRENRDARRELFAEELAAATVLLGKAPELGSPFAARGGVVIRRMLLRRTQHHVYYAIDREADMVMIVAVWGTPKGETPDF